MNLIRSRLVRVSAIAIFAVFLAGCKSEAPAAVTPPPPEVTASKPVEREITDFLEFTGRTESPEVVDIRARVSGYLLKVNFVDGQEVKAGDALFDIDPRPFDAALLQAKAELARTVAVLANATTEHARRKTLREKNAVSQEDLDRSTADKAVAEAAKATAEQQIVTAELDVEFAQIKAPIAGRVSKANTSVGNLISPGDGTSRILTTIVSVDPMHVYFDIDEQALLRYKEILRKSGKLLKLTHVKELKLPVQVSLGDKEGYVHTGQLDFVDNQVKASTGTIRARAEMPNKDRTFVPGLFVRVRLPFGGPHKVLQIPDRAISTDQGLRYVLVVNDKEQVERRDVTLGSLTDGQRVIDTGLKPDDWVIVNGIQRARPGATVKALKK